MSSEIEILETPNWLLELEAKRERRLKARLGHETGAGAPCLKCHDKCPGLDLHFWRKCCKVCKCSKEEHEVPDDDIYGWAQFQLLGSKPNKIKRKILLPGKKDELELDWAPKGNTETVDRYLKTLPPDQLPVKGSQAAQNRKQLLHKQIPIHDIDPALCHDLTDDELSKMNDYIAHVKQSSVGVGQIVSLSSVIKGNLHMLDPCEAALISSRFPKGIPVSDVVKLHAQNKAMSLSKDLQKIHIHSENSPNYIPNAIKTSEKMHPLKIYDRKHIVYPNQIMQDCPIVQYSSNLGRPKNVEVEDQMPLNSDEKYHNPNSNASAFVPYSVDLIRNDNSLVGPDYVNNQRGKQRYLIEGEEQAQPFENIYKHVDCEHKPPVEAECSTKFPGKRIPYHSNGGNDTCSTEQPSYGNIDTSLSQQMADTDCQTAPDMSHTGTQCMQSYDAEKYNIRSDIQMPISIPKNIKDLASSTYDLSNADPNVLLAKINKCPISSSKNHSDPYFANRSLVKDIISKAHPDFNLLGDGKVIAEDGESKMSDTETVGRVKFPKKLSERFPNSSRIDEDFVHPSDVRIGAIQDICIEYPPISAAVGRNNDLCEDYSSDSIKEIINNIKLPDCYHCKKPFEENEFAVTIDRANVLFHAKCFKCAGCNQMLVDNMYFYHKETENIYCGRDYAKVRGVPRCKACDELIFTKEYTLAENATFHLKHFCCIECDTPLADRHYTLEDGMPYCLPCFEQSKANKCSGCLNVIKPDEIGCSLNGIHFHATDMCFACKVCRKPLMGKKLLLRSEKLYCSHECHGLAK